ncbi:putative bifunctional diguanylate cyclase/phosphodiesterase [Halovibrio salipaludis]|nr:GGDEF domain-containing phosphodiesterase [Halovibrio salipaludis]
MAYQCLNDTDWSMLFVNERARDLTGYSPDDFLSSRITLARVIHESDRSWVSTQVDAAIEARDSFNLTYRIRHRDGQVRWVWEQGQGVFSEEGELLWLEGFIHDITEQQHSRHLQEAVYRIASAVTERSGQAFYHGLAEHLARALGADAAYLATFDEEAGAQQLAIQALVLFGRSRGSMCAAERTAFTDEVMETGYSVFTAGAGEAFPLFTDSTPAGLAGACVGVRLDSKQGSALGMMAVLFNQPIENPELSMSVMRIFGSGASAEIERQNYEQSIRTLAYQDSVTGLPNRVAFMEELERAGDQYLHQGQRLSLVFLDLRRFKELNDTRGTCFGDRVLSAVGERFTEVLEPDAYLARLGGNEYAVLLPGMDREALQAFMHRIQAQLDAPLEIHGEQCSIGTSVGGASFPGDAESMNELYQHASIALHHAKVCHSGIGLYDAAMARNLHRKEQLASHLRRALSRQALMLHFQPQFDLTSGELVGAEVLCRWHDEELGWVSPAEFIPLAEERGLIHELSDWVLAEGCRQLQAWKAEGKTLPGSLSINISAQQFDTEDLVERLRDLCLPVQPQELTLELTESAFMDDPAMAIKLSQRLREAGFRVAIDDFGTGYSSLAYLRDLHVDTLKVDMSFVRSMLRDERDRTIVETIVAMARTLGLRTVAEGVETRDHEQALRAMGCGASQGFYYGRPCDAAAFSRQWLSG